jgi:hypothetical protein
MVLADTQGMLWVAGAHRAPDRSSTHRALFVHAEHR